MNIEFSADFRRKAGQHVHLLNADILPALRQMAEDAEPHYDDQTRRRMHEAESAELHRDIEEATHAPEEKYPGAPEEEPLLFGGERIEPAEGRNSDHLTGFFKPQIYDNAAEYFSVAERIRDILRQIQTGDETLIADPWQLSAELTAVCSLAQGLAASSPYFKDSFLAISQWLSDDKEINRRLDEAEALKDAIRTLDIEGRRTKIGFDLPGEVCAEAQVIADSYKRKRERLDRIPMPVYPDEEMAFRKYANEDMLTRRMESHFGLIAKNYHTYADRMGGIIRETFAAARAMAETYGSKEGLDFMQRHEEALREVERRADETFSNDLRQLRSHRGGQGEGKSR